jgi:hypothetical protein
MKAKLLPSSPFMILRACLALSALLLYLAIQPVRAAPATIVGGAINTNTDWNLAGSPYLVNSYVDVVAGVALTIEPGVIVGNYDGGGSQSYNFTVEGTLVANGTAADPIVFNPGSNGWSGINITGQPGVINTGSVLNWVVVEGGGSGGSGVGADLRLQYAVVDVHNSLFNHSPGDGILGDDASAQGVANIYDSTFVGNAGYAVNFQDGSVNPVLSNLTASGNGASLGYGGNVVAINDATLSPGLHIWENMGLPYLILGTMVGPDSQLTIEPGVQVLSFPGNDKLDVQGSLLADGTVSQPIHFDPLTTTLGWSGIAIMGTDVFPSAGGVLNHVIITKGGFTGGSCDLYVEYGNARVTNSQLDSSQDSGVCLDHGATLVMTNTQLTNNQEYAMDVIDAGASFYLDGLTASGNLSDTIGIQGGTLTGEHTWAKSGINTYDLHYSYVTIAPTGTLTIEPGVTVLFGETRDITVHGILNAIGTPTEPITFTSETHPQGLWAGLSFIGTAEQHAVGHLAYATAEYGGYGGSAMIYIENADVTFTHCILRYCAHDAIEIQPGRAVADQSVGIGWSRLHDIGGYAIQNGSSQAVQAIYNWWGAASGPTADGNPDGTGSSLLGPVHYWPFLIAPEARIVFLPMTLK